MKEIKKILNEAIRQEEVVKAGRAQRIFRKWPEIVGPILAQKSYPERYDRGVIWVAVAGSSWAQELRMQRESILQKMRQISGEPELFKSIRFGVRPVPIPEFAVIEVPVPDKELKKKEIEHLSIREIAERRLKRMRHEDDTRE